MRLITPSCAIVGDYGELKIGEDHAQKCIHIWFIPTNLRVDVDGNHIRLFRERDKDETNS